MHDDEVMITGADAVVVQYYIANLHTSHVTDIQADRQTRCMIAGRACIASHDNDNENMTNSI